MPSKALISAAGSGKTTYIVEEALKSNKRVLILTYTNENLFEINKRFREKKSVIPQNIKVQSWYTFLLKEGVRPYQNYLYSGKRIGSLYFEAVPESVKVPKTNIKYYLTSTGKVYRDRISDFVCECNDKSGSLTIDRLEKMYDEIYIDEVQDLAGWDLVFLDSLLNSKIDITFVGDIRQATYATNNSTKNPKYRGKGILTWFQEREKKGKCAIEYRTVCFRCNQTICDFADSLYPELEKATSDNKEVTGHDGLFFIKSENVQGYIDKFNPKILKNNKDVETLGKDSINFGLSKGQSYPRVLIYPTGTIQTFLKNGKLVKIVKGKTVNAFDIAKLYVAITRAKYSVAFVFDSIPFFKEILEYQPII